MSFLIIAGPGDPHVAALAWAMAHYGTHVLVWHPAPPWTRPGSVRFANGLAPDFRFAAGGGDVGPAAIDGIWLRRWPNPTYPESFGEGERLAARTELNAFHRGVLALLPEDIFWANPVAARDLAYYKLAQLQAAQAAGFKIPETLVTDDAEQARAFAAGRRSGGIIYKPFFGLQWQRDDRLAHTVTTRIDEADLDDPQQLIWCPGIFQKFVPKAYELRVCVFGRTCVTAKISGQDPVDWRTSQSDMSLAPAILPEGVERAIHRFMDAMGLVMGMIDLIVTPEGDFVFLEVNEQGQFLWIEDVCPDFGLLDVCARFFASRDPRFVDAPTPSAGLRFADFRAAPECEESLREARAFQAAGGVHNLLVIRE